MGSTVEPRSFLDGTAVAMQRRMDLVGSSSRWLLAAAFTTFLAAGCVPSADAACVHYLELRRLEKLPANADVMKACVKDVDAAKQKLPEGGAKVPACVKGATSVDDADRCPSRATKGKEREKAEELWPDGLAADASSAWADRKVLDDEACHEGARAIARKKAAAGIIRDGEREKHTKELLDACKAEMTNAGYVETFACLRKADGEKELVACSAASKDAAKATVIEGCVKKCKGEHGDSSSPGYMPCFTSCRAAGGF